MTELGGLAPDFALTDARGVLHRLPHAPATAVYFTSNRCPASLAWQPRLSDVAAAYTHRNVKFIAINVPCQFPGPVGARMPTPDGREGIAVAIHQTEWRNITYLDGSDLHAARAWGARVTPDLFLLDHDRRVRYRGAPDGSQFEPNENARWLRDALDAVLAGRRPPFVPTNLVGCPIKWRPNRNESSIAP